MKVVVAGKGGREHALALKLKESSLITELIVCPGNPGMIQEGITCAAVESPDDLVAFCIAEKVALVVVGPEALILSDLKVNLEEHGIYCFAPSRAAAQLEASKVFCKKILKGAGVNTASFTECQTEQQALAVARAHDFNHPIVIKADGLAQGKGVWVCENLAKSEEAIAYLGKQYGYPLLAEECLQGRELSAFALCDGKEFVILGTACDYKRITPDPFSANTGGMGAYSPCDFISKNDEDHIQEIFRKSLSHLHELGIPFQGFLFAGLMKTPEGLSVLEFNVRMGDPETQALMLRIRSDFGKLVFDAVTHDLNSASCDFTEMVSVHVVATSQGYPQAEMKLGHTIQYPEKKQRSSTVYFSGVSLKDQKLINTGGRVLGLTALAKTKEAAREIVYQDLRKISFEGMYSRQDIGL